MWLSKHCNGHYVTTQACTLISWGCAHLRWCGSLEDYTLWRCNIPPSPCAGALCPAQAIIWYVLDLYFDHCDQLYFDTLDWFIVLELCFLTLYCDIKPFGSSTLSIFPLWQPAGPQADNISPSLQTLIVRRAGLLWSQQDFGWWWSVPLSSASLY